MATKIAAAVAASTSTSERTIAANNEPTSPRPADFAADREIAELRAQVRDLERQLEASRAWVVQSVRQPSKSLNGLSLMQARAVLEQIATTSGTLVDLCMSGADRASDIGESQINFHIAQMLGERIGALADHVLDGEIRGKAVDWMIGGDYRDQAETSQT